MTTIRRSEYVKHPMPDKPLKEAVQWVPNKAALDDISNYKKDYVAKQVNCSDGISKGITILQKLFNNS